MSNLSDDDKKIWKQVKKIAKNALRSEIKQAKRENHISQRKIDDIAIDMLHKAANFIKH